MMLVKHDSEKQQQGLALNAEEIHTQALAVRAMKTVEPGKTESEKSFTSLTGLDEVAKLQQQLSDYRNGGGNLTVKGAYEVGRELALGSNGPQMSAPPTPEETAYSEEQKLQLQNNLGIATAGVGAVPAAAAAAMGARPIVVNGLLNLGAGVETGVEGLSVKLARSPLRSALPTNTTAEGTSNNRGPYGGEPLNGPPLGLMPKGASQRGSVGNTTPPTDGQNKPLSSNGAGNGKTAAGVTGPMEGTVNKAQPQTQTEPRPQQVMASSNPAGAGGRYPVGAAGQPPAGAQAPAPVELKEVKLPPMRVTLTDGRVKDVPVNLLIREQDMLDPVSGKPRNFDGMGDAIEPLLRRFFDKDTRKSTDKETSMNRRFEALTQLDVFVREPVELNADHRYGRGGKEIVKGGVPELLILWHARDGLRKDLSQAPMRAFMARSSLVPTELGGTIKSFTSRGYQESRVELLREQETLTKLVDGLSRAPEIRGKQEKLDSYQTRRAHNQAIMQQLDARTEGYKEKSPGGEYNRASVRHGLRDSTALSMSSIPELYQPHHDLKYGLPVTMKTISLPDAARSEIPVNLTLPDEMLQKHLKTMDGKGGILAGEAMPPFSETIDLQALRQAVIEQVEQHGGHASTQMTSIQKDAITDINVIYLGTRKISDNPGASSHTKSGCSDDRIVVVVHRARGDGRELPPIVMQGALHQADSWLFQRQVAQGTLAADAPLALVLLRKNSQFINDELGKELEILAKQAHWYATGDDPAPRHDASLYPRGPNEQQSASYAQRYEEVKAALEAFNQEALRYRASAEQSTTVAQDIKTRDVKTSSPDVEVLDEALWAPQYNDLGPNM